MKHEPTFGEWLRAEREARGFPKIAEFARAIGKTRSYIDQIEKNKINPSSGRPLQPSIEAVDEIARVLGLSPTLVREKAGYGLDEPTPVNAEEVQAVEIIRALNPNVRKHAMASLQAFRLLSMSSKKETGDEESKKSERKGRKGRPKEIELPAKGEEVFIAYDPPTKRKPGEQEDGENGQENNKIGKRR